MSQTAKVFMYDGSQAVCLPADIRFNTAEVFVRQDPETGDVILSRRPADWGDFFAALRGTEIPDEFLSPRERFQQLQDRDPLAE